MAKREDFPHWDYPFNHGPIERKEAEKRLQKCGQACFLIRSKGTGGTEYVYSFFDSTGYRHAKIEITNNAYVLDGKEYKQNTKPDLYDVVSGFEQLHKENNIAVGAGLPRPDLTTTRILISGQMCKRAVGKSMFGKDGWKIRWFELSSTYLRYFSRKDGPKKGAIKVSQMVACEPTDPVLFGKPNVFLIVFQQFICYIQTQDQASLNAWVLELRKLIRAGNRVITSFCPGSFAGGKWNCCGKQSRAEGCRPTSFFHAAPWYFPELSRQTCELIMKTAHPGDYIARKSGDGHKIVMMVMDDAHRLRHFYLTPQPDNTVEITPNVFVNSLDEALKSFRSHPPQGADGVSIMLKQMVKVDEGIPGADSVQSDGTSETLLWQDKDTTDDGADLTFNFEPLDEYGFERLDTHDTLPEELPSFARGRGLNRYWDILPNPVTRVKLKVQPGEEPRSEYINANYIRGYSDRSAREYIAAQAPEKHTEGRFLRMLWESHVDIIVCLTKLFQEGKVKCHRYWPVDEEEPVQNGIYKLTLISSEFGDGLVKYLFEITDGEDTRRIDMFWMNSWPDHGVPTVASGEMDTRSILSLIYDVREARRRRRNANPILVHCSAGIGRTGAFIAIDHCIHAMQDRKRVDILKTIDAIRCDRMGLIQHTNQYKFVYQAALDYARTRFSSANIEVQVPVTNKRMSEGMLQDTMSKTSTWKLKNLGEKIATFTLADKPAGLRMSESDKSIIDDDKNEKVDPPPTPKSAVEARRKELENRPLHKQPWFRGDFSRAQAEEILEDGHTGMFIVRASSQPGLYSISVQIGMDNGTPSKITNMLCLPCDATGVQVDANVASCFKLGDFGEDFKPTIPKLVYHYMSNPYARDEITNAYMYLKYNPDESGDGKMMAATSTLAQKVSKLPPRTVSSMC
eukprot:m.240647 g.240647  ORF g.240647 m.240647 type:complete len:909 (-) comp33766_c0_seq1:82-2808(-)